MAAKKSFTNSIQETIDYAFDSDWPLTDTEIEQALRLADNTRQERDEKILEARQEALQGALDGLDEELAQREAEDASRASERADRLNDLFGPTRLRRGSPLDD